MMLVLNVTMPAISMAPQKDICGTLHDKQPPMMLAANTDLAVALAEMEIPDRKVRAVHVNREVATGAAREVLDLQRVVSARAPSVC
jgi:hypothetical protein